MNPEGTYRLGVKHAFDLYPDRLKDRMKYEYKKWNWDESLRQAVSNVSREISQFDTKHSSEYLIYDILGFGWLFSDNFETKKSSVSSIKFVF